MTLIVVDYLTGLVGATHSNSQEQEVLELSSYADQAILKVDDVDRLPGDPVPDGYTVVRAPSEGSAPIVVGDRVEPEVAPEETLPVELL